MDEVILGTESALAYDYERSRNMLEEKSFANLKRIRDHKCKMEQRLYMGKSQKRSKFKAVTRRKGLGRELKEKGKTMPTIFCLNGQCAKGWARTQGNRKESFSALWIWEVT